MGIIKGSSDSPFSRSMFTPCGPQKSSRGQTEFSQNPNTSGSPSFLGLCQAITMRTAEGMKQDLGPERTVGRAQALFLLLQALYGLKGASWTVVAILELNVGCCCQFSMQVEGCRHAQPHPLVMKSHPPMVDVPHVCKGELHLGNMPYDGSQVHYLRKGDDDFCC